MRREIFTLGVLAMAFGLFTSCKMNAQNNGDKQQRREPPSTDELFKAMDANEDDLLSKEELEGPIKKDFAKIDTNEDGFLSKEEIEKAPKPKRGGGRPQGKQ